VLNEILGLHNKPKAAVHSVHKLTGSKKKKKTKKKKKKKKMMMMMMMMMMVMMMSVSGNVDHVEDSHILWQ